ncbi:MAG: type II secretion system F family protein [Microthrixaceae bacterium]|jgi:Flp pilus assembly protein TadB|nr:type II secretion system F family protein [Microthrixaceae bacterium]
MTAAVLTGALAAWGISLVVTGLVPARVSLGDALERLDAPATVADDSPAQWWVRLLGVPLVDTRFGQAWLRPASRDLRVIGRSAAEHLARTVALVAVALLWAPATFGLIALGGVDVTWVLPLWVSIVLGAVALVVPALEVRAEAAERRRSFRHALGCFLDLVAVRLAGGAGVDSALAGSAAAGDGWAFTELRQALTDARLRSEPSWNGLAHLGEAIGVDELQELAASAGLAGDEGARVRVSIAAKARAIRMRGLADAEGAAQSASERMSLPVVLLMTGFIVFLGYPAIAAVLNGL